MKKSLFILAAVVLLSLLLLMAWLNQQPAGKSPATITPQAETPPSPERNLAQVLIANYPLQAGAFLRGQDLVWQTLPESSQVHLDAMFLYGFIDPAQLEGSLVTRNLVAGQILTVDDIIRPEQSHYLSSMMSPGMRAVTLALNPAAVSHGLLRPGNRVDIILASENESVNDAQGQAVPNRLSAEIVLENIKLLAIAAQLAGTEKIVVEPGSHQFEPVNVTFELTPDNAARLLLADRLGDISLVLRGREDLTMPRTAVPKIIWAQDVSENHHPNKQPGKGIRIFRGDTLSLSSSEQKAG
ncbi:Flp pilus assembly protein CpaB [Motilimonas cestriensis]|uniref:Flp pilus assembly protein CpaB n=1 Tax=Motilimonas cestriensis TaxID=2742685 RepID=A0ABS8WE41_9GAMM|nr:Flp pilus assembly protein CpaB [Motilimonas cestriensis]MCE2596755.1 Flp pilus assembly protein CpaB [Motilimonas cestriensis]